MGTTAVRTLESIVLQVANFQVQKGDTEIYLFIPDLSFKLVDAMITNFHLPKSSLLMFGKRFYWYSMKMFQIYQYAIEEKYRFFSYGDAMLVRENAID